MNWDCLMIFSILFKIVKISKMMFALNLMVSAIYWVAIIIPPILTISHQDQLPLYGPQVFQILVCLLKFLLSHPSSLLHWELLDRDFRHVIYYVVGKEGWYKIGMAEIFWGSKEVLPLVHGNYVSTFPSTLAGAIWPWYQRCCYEHYKYYAQC